MRRKVLVCGSRDWTDHKVIHRRLAEKDCLPALIIHGGATGADKMAEGACVEHAVHSVVVKPRWESFGKSAGFLRNCAMLDLEPDLVIAFSTGSRGTQLTIDEARKRGIPVEVIGREAA